ncbi:non-ribosomal peptide synthetase [Streptomyces tendae]|uniref:non-ribosomal peptide synthetase n=1 Tax=Streptomyces tendae TaxID=1932 RepID=UPI0024937594|nr:non-ribosomal peptide synthetase [Streptomyces tendae]
MTVLDSYRLSPQQRRIWADNPDGRIRARVGISEPLDEPRLMAAAAAVVARHEALRLKIGDLTGTGLPVQIVEDDAAAAFLAADGPGPDAPLRVVLSPTELVVEASALVADQESLLIVVAELAALYDGRPPVEHEDRTQFLDVAEWQAEEEQVRLPADPTALTSLVLPYRGKADLADAGPRIECAAPVGGPTSAQARVLAAWATALGRYAGEDGDSRGIVVAWYDSGRSVEGADGVVGPLACWTGLTVPPASDATAVEELLTQARARSLRVAPLEDASAAGFSFVTLPAAGEPAAFGATEVAVDAPSGPAPLHLECTARDDRLELVLHADPGAASPLAARMLLESVAAILDGTEPHGTEAALLDRWQGTAAPPAETTVLRLLDDAVRTADPRRVAVDAPDARLTFSELDAVASSIAQRLGDEGVRPGDRVIVVGERSATTVAAFLGVLRAGAVYVPVDPAHPVAWLRRLATTVGTTIAIAVKGSTALRGLAPTVPTLELDPTTTPRPTTASQPVEPTTASHPVEPSDAAYVIFTSGSSGTPRPVVVEHGNAAQLFEALEATVYAAAPENLTVAVNAPFAFDASVKQLIQLAAGRSLCLVDEETRRDVAALLRNLDRQGADVLDCTPSHLSLILDHREPGQRLPGLLLVGGEAVDEELWQRLAALDGVRAVNVYGPTECAVDVTWAEIGPDTAPTIGRPLPGFRLQVLDPQGRPVPPGCPGELFVAGPQVARGYWNDPEATAARFAVVGGVRGYHTGDRVRFLDDGTLAYLGRVDEQIKINGHRAEPAEIAAVVARHPAVARAAVDWRVDEETGNGALVAYAVPRRTGDRPIAVDDIAGINPHETRYLFDEIFVQQTYLRGGITLREDAVVVDVGANIGMFSLFVDQACPSARILAFEPLTEAFSRLGENLGGRSGPTELFDFGLSDREWSTEFTVYPGYSMMSGQAEYADPAAEIALVKTFLENSRDQELLGQVGDVLADRFSPVGQDVQLRRLSDVLVERGVDRVDLLKIDVQRAEWDVLRGLDDTHLANVQQIAMEVHDETGGDAHGRVAEITAYLSGHGFDVFSEQDELLHGTDRFALCAVRPGYRADPRPAAEPPTAVPDEALLRQWLVQRLPEPLVPTATVFVDELPLTANGKLDRAALPAPDLPRAAVAQPTNDVERTLVEVWEEVLGRRGIGVDDNFFAMGGDSIRAIRMRVAALRAGVTFPLRDVFRSQTIRGLAAGVEAPETTERNETAAFALIDAADRAKVPAGAVDMYPLTALQFGMIYHSELSGGSTYHVVTVDTVEGPWDPDALRRAAAELTATHEILRTSFALTGFSRPMQLVHDTAEIPVRCLDLSALSEPDRQHRLREVVDREKTTPFEWRKAPLLRLCALRTGERTFELVQTHFHGVLDGLSLHLMTRELLTHYDRLMTGAAAPPPAEVLPYRRYVETEIAAQRDEGTRAFWRDAVEGVEPLLLAGGEVPCVNASRVLAWDATTSEEFDRAARGAGVPLKSLFMAAHVRALAAVCDRREVVTGLVVSGRLGEEGGDRTLGLFLNTLPVRAGGDTPVDELSIGELAAGLWKSEQALMGHHALPLADIQNLAARGSLFDTFFNFTRFDAVAPAAEGTRVVTEHDDTVDVGFALVANADVGPHGARLIVQYDEDRIPVERLNVYTDRLRTEVTDLVAQYGRTTGDNR